MAAILHEAPTNARGSFPDWSDFAPLRLKARQAAGVLSWDLASFRVRHANVGGLDLAYFFLHPTSRIYYLVKNVYQQTDRGWILVFKGQSFSHACEVCLEMQAAEPAKQFCVNQ